METNALDAIKLAKPGAAGPLESAADRATLDRDSFLRMFITQLENQDPLEPQDASQLAAQLAQYSQLEQSLRATEALAGIKGTLDELLALERSRQVALDPVSLLGRQVEVSERTLQSGGASALSFDVASPMKTLSVRIFDSEGELVASIPLEPERATGTFPLGTYQLDFEDGLRLRDPQGEPVFVEKTPRVGELESVTVHVDGLPATKDAVREELPLTVGGIVTGVRFVDGTPRIVIDGREVDAARVLRVVGN